MHFKMASSVQHNRGHAGEGGPTLSLEVPDCWMFWECISGYPKKLLHWKIHCIPSNSASVALHSRGALGGRSEIDKVQKRSVKTARGTTTKWFHKRATVY